MNDLRHDTFEELLSSNELDGQSAKDSKAILEAMAQIFTGTARLSNSLVDGGAGREPAHSFPSTTGIALVTVDGESLIRSFGAAAQAIFGYEPEEIIGQPLARLLRDDSAELRGQRRDGSSFPVAIARDEIEAPGARLTTIALWDVSKRGVAEAERREAEVRYRSLIEQIPAVTFMGALSGDVIELYVSPQIESLLGFSQEEWLSDPFLWFRQLHPDDRDLCNREFARGCLTGGPFRAEFRALTRAADIVWIRGEARMVRDNDGRPLFIQGIAYDITESKRAEEAVRAHAEQMKASLAEKEVLLKEIHHRVKNNLQVISSLLKLQSGHVHDKAALDMFNESRGRIQTMALVHEKLYQSGNLSQIDFAAYVESLTTLLLRSYSSRGNWVTIEKEIREVSLGIDVAVPLGMIINELVSNSLKYAFPPDRAGRIRLELGRATNGFYFLTIADDGVGLPPDFDFTSTGTLGMQLVRMLTQQIGGTIEISKIGGTEFRISFET